MELFHCRLAKVDEARREITGIATREEIDKDGECMDYASTKPRVAQWASEVWKDSSGRSLGNVREMHSNNAVGVLRDVHFDDADRSVHVVAHIVDDAAWQKCVAGVFTGFSVGGKYVKKWRAMVDGKPVTKYTADISELSIVDRPCVPSARFLSVHKRDGSVQRVPFKSRSDEMTQVIPNANDAEGRNAFTAALRKIHARGGEDLLAKYFAQPESAVSTTTADGLRKLAQLGLVWKGLPLPPQSENGVNDDQTADDGASTSVQHEPVPGQPKPLLGPRQEASVQPGTKPTSGGQDASLQAIKEALSVTNAKLLTPRRV